MDKKLKEYNVSWEVSKHAVIEAKNEEEAIKIVINQAKLTNALLARGWRSMEDEIEQFEDEITASPVAREIKS
jgi:hypothetical protein|tara:strand:+ start:1052 stop:1270 length:219 start_codon:yes stop_codon:yes gene_type:complete